MEATRLDPSLIFQLATGYWSSAVLLAANELGIFGRLAAGPARADQVADALATDPRATRILLDACAGLGLIEKQAEQYGLNASAAAFLVPGSPASLGTSLRWSQDQYERWGRLAETVRRGQPALPPVHLGADPRPTRVFVQAMHERALGVAQQVVHFIDVQGCRDLLDIGGGPAAYAMLLARKHPELRIHVLDLPAIVAVGQELLRDQGLQDRVLFISGDATQDDYGSSQYDAILFSGVLHQMGEPTIRHMFAQARRALRPEGRVIVCDMMLDACKTTPVFSALFSLQMLQSSAAGQVFAVAECEKWLREAGFAKVTSTSLPKPLPYHVVRGEG